MPRQIQSEGVPVFGMFDSVFNLPLGGVEHEKLLREQGRLFAQFRPEGYWRYVTSFS